MGDKKMEKIKTTVMQIHMYQYVVNFLSKIHVRGLQTWEKMF